VKSELQTIYPLSATLLPKEFSCSPAESLVSQLKQHPEICRDMPYLTDLARVELAAYSMATHPVAIPTKITKPTVHPGLDLIEVDWLGLVDLLKGNPVTPVPGKAFVLLMPDGDSKSVQILSPSNYDLLALKIVAEKIDTSTAARQAQVSVGYIDNIIYNAGQKGLLLLPPSKLVRPKGFCRDDIATKELCSTPSFTLQWHITQKCDLHCRHCYDRSDRTSMSIDQGLHILDDFYRFCKDHHVYGQVSFTGGNPMLSPHFYTLYQEAASRGFLTAVLGNPMGRASLDKMTRIQTPEFYQVSLEGLQEHNDYIRGAGHFDRVLDFLLLLKEMKIYSMVMLTLTRENMAQVLPLAEILRNKTDLFTFNRLAMMGEGAALASVEPVQYKDFLDRFVHAAADNPIISLKDNFCNLHLYQEGAPLKGGCAGYGCGAAFNFVSVLPDGEVHACRKLPSLLGNIFNTSLTDIYHSPLAKRYRMGSSACTSCEIRPVCGGCPAVVSGFGLDIFNDLDPYCFKNNPPSSR
jgi:selenobiotic family peptide radical SAM maturase